MLKQDAVPAESSVPPVSVAQARVTPDELSHALAAIEARRQAEAAHLAGTIPIDQAVSDLHLDSTPDEIWAEVSALRAKAAAAKATPQEKSQQTVPPVSVTAPVVRARPRGWRRLIAPVLVIGVLMGTGVIPHSFTPHGFSPSLLTSQHLPTAAPILRPLSQVPTDVEVYADASALAQISAGKPLNQIAVSENDSGNRWKIVKRSGHVYLRGYIARADSLQSLQNQALNVYSNNDAGELEGERTSNITLRIDKIPLSAPRSGDDYLSVTVPNFQSDPPTTLDPGS